MDYPSERSGYIPPFIAARWPVTLKCGRQVLLEDVMLAALARDRAQDTPRRDYTRGVNARVDGATLKEVGAIWNVTPSRAGQILSSICKAAVSIALDEPL